MASIPYNKLVRDLIPDIIAKGGQRAVTRMLTSEEYPEEIGKKFAEEGAEYVSAPNREERLRELCDALQLIHDAAARDEATIGDIEALRIEKLAQRGGFTMGIFLEEVVDDK